MRRSISQSHTVQKHKAKRPAAAVIETFEPRQLFSQVLTNASFESGLTGWVSSGNFYAQSNAAKASSGSGYAAGGIDATSNPINNASGSISQSAFIPAGASATLSFKYSVATTETGAFGASDFLYAKIRNSFGQDLATIKTISNLDSNSVFGGSTASYSSFSADVSAFAGQTVQVSFVATTDYGDRTLFRVDDVALNVTTTQPVTGNLNVTARGVNGALTPGATVKLFAGDWTYLQAQLADSNGVASFGNLVAGSYHLELWSPVNTEFWGGDQATVSSGNTASITLNRIMPYATDCRVYSGNTDVIGSTVSAGTQLRFDIKVINLTSAAQSVQSSLWADRDQLSPYDFAYTQTAQNIVANGGTGTFSFYYTPTAAGLISRQLEVQTFINNTFTRSDMWNFGSIVTVSSAPAVNHAPTAPGQPAASNVANTSATVSWNASSDSDGDTITYELYYARAYSLDSWTSAGTTTSASKVLSGLSPNQQYSLRVVTRDGRSGQAESSRTGAFTTTTTPTPPPPPVNAGGTYQAEDALFDSHSTRATGNAVPAYVDYGGSGSYVQWTVNRTAAGNAKLTFSYANNDQNGYARNCTVIVNGVSVVRLAFNKTGSWSNWATDSFTARLNAGTNIIRVVAGQYGGPNMDLLTVSNGASPLKINHAAFINAYRSAFDSNVAGLDQLLGFFEADNNITDVRWVAYMLATVKAECGGFMHASETLANRQGKPYNNGDSVTGLLYYGRGYSQITWAGNYASVGNAIGVDLYHHPELALQPDISYKILSYGMRMGAFTGVGLDWFLNDSKTDYYNARKTENSLDRAATIEGWAKQFEAMLTNA